MDYLSCGIEEIEDLFVSMGYDIVSGPELETDEFCFERLNLPKARESPEKKVKKRMFKITKRDDEQMLAFGWANVSIRSDGELIEDWQEDIVEPEDLEQAAYEFVQLYREGGEMHERGGVATLVESVVFTEEKQRAMGIPEGTLPVGWWIGFKVLDADVWEKVKDGTYSMFSIEGERKRRRPNRR